MKGTEDKFYAENVKADLPDDLDLSNDEEEEEDGGGGQCVVDSDTALCSQEIV